MKILSRAMIAASALAMFSAMPALAKTFVYCSEASPEGFDPAPYTAGTTFDASAHPIYNRLVEFKKGTTEIEPVWPKAGKCPPTVWNTPSSCVRV
jgi:dipeptide transport system substrate-binding protein